MEGDMLSQPVRTAIQSGPSTQPPSTALLRRIDGKSKRMNTDFAFKSALELSRAVASREVSPVELMQATLARVELLNPGLNCFAAYAPEQALEAAKQAEHALMAGQPLGRLLGRLHGLPISVKDLIAVKDLKFSFGSRVMADNVATADAPSVERIRSAGACIIGKTTTSAYSGDRDR